MQNSSEQRQAEKSLARILPRLEERHSGAKWADWSAFRARLEANFPDLFGLLVHLYGGQYDFFYHLENMLDMAARMWLARPAELKELDAGREQHPTWFQSERKMGGECYVDIFA